MVDTECDKYDKRDKRDKRDNITYMKNVTP